MRIGYNPNIIKFTSDLQKHACYNFNRYVSDDIVSGLSEHIWESINDSIFEQTRNFLIVYDCEF
jgi:hypothetical protein